MFLFRLVIFLLFIVIADVRILAQNHSSNFDIFIINACVFDGSMNDSSFVNIGISGNKITYIGKNKPSPNIKKIIDARGLILTPGFIDPHTHADSALHSKDKFKRSNLTYLSQGVTTVAIGNDGWGVYNIKDQFDEFRRNKIGTNVVAYVGYGTVREAVMKYRQDTPSLEELKQMESLVKKAMIEGAIGLSTGLSYLPQKFSKTEEIINLAKIASVYGGIYDTHMRNQGIGSISAIDETIAIAKQANIPVHISHIKASGPAAFGLSSTIVKHIDSAILNGVNVSASVYPYLAAGDNLDILLPTWVKKDGKQAIVNNLNNKDSIVQILKWIDNRIKAMGGGDKIQIFSPYDKRYHGKSILYISKEKKKSEPEIVVEILKQYPMAEVHSFVMIESDMLNFMKQKWVVTCSDGVDGHPRAAGSFARVLSYYAIKRKEISIKKAVHSATGLTATFLHIKDRGFVRKGYYADIVLFDPKTIKDNATYENPSLPPTGIKYVIVNGKIVIENGIYNNAQEGMPIQMR